MGQASSWPLESTEGTEFGLIPRPELSPVLLHWAVEGTIGIMVSAVIIILTEVKHGRKSSEAALGSVWGAGGGVTVSLPSMPGCNGDGSGARRGRAGAAGPGAAALALTRSVVIGNWTAEEPGCRFYGNVLEQ